MAHSNQSSKHTPLDLSENAQTVLKRRYLVKDENGAPTESPEDLFCRVGRTIASPDAD